MVKRNIQRLTAIAALSGLTALAAGAAKADIISANDIANGLSISYQQCSALEYAVWVSARNQSFCIRYYVSTKGGAQGRPIVFLQGDEKIKIDPRTRQPDPAHLRNVDTANLVRMADAFSRDASAPAIYLARPGMDGSSGHHYNVRHSVLELEIVNAALDAIRRKHNFDGFNLAGQSGGASLIGALIAMRQDIGCAIPGSGRLARLGMSNRSADPSRRTFDPMDGLAAVVRNSTTRIIVLTDPQDQVVKLPHQSTFVQALQQKGRAVEQYFIQATDDSHHGAVAHARRAMTLCMQNVQPAQMSADLDDLSRRRVAAAQRQRLAQQQPAVQPSQQPMPGQGPAPRVTRVTGVQVQPSTAPAQMPVVQPQPIRVQQMQPVQQIQPVPQVQQIQPVQQVQQIPVRVQPVTALPRISINLPGQAPATPAVPAAPARTPSVTGEAEPAQAPAPEGVRNDWPRMSSIPSTTVIR